MNINEMKKALAIKALRETGGNRNDAAKIMGVCVKTVRNYIRKFDLRAEFPPPHWPYKRMDQEK